MGEPYRGTLRRIVHDPPVAKPVTVSRYRTPFDDVVDEAWEELRSLVGAKPDDPATMVLDILARKTVYVREDIVRRHVSGEGR